MRPPYLIFLHIPKTAGSTLRSVLRRRYKKSEIYAPDIAGSPDAPFLRYLREEADEFDFTTAVDGNAHQLRQWDALDDRRREAIKLLIGHFWFGLDERLPGPSTYLTMLRDPIDRALSMYAHRVATQGLRLSVDQYVANGREWDTVNGQTRRLALRGPGDGPGPVTETMLDVAMERLATRFCAVGVTERFDESMVAFARALGWRSLGYEAENRSKTRPSRDLLHPDTHELLLERNQLDLRLHEFASKCLDASLADIDVAGQLGRMQRDKRITWMRNRVAYAARFPGRLVRPGR